MKVAVVGCGVIGLSSAIRLRERGIDVTIFTQKRTPDTTSDRAGAVFTPFRAGDRERVRQWTRDSYAAFVALAQYPGPSCGVQFRTMREFFFTPQPKAPWWVDLIPSARRMTQAPSGYADAYEALMPHMDMTRYMPWLEDQYLGSGGGIVIETIGQIGALFDRGFDTVVNCSGLGARTLCDDAAMSPMRGQIIHVKNSLRLTESLVEEGRGELVTYIFPHDDHIVLGGTYEVGQWTEQTDPAALEAILLRCREMLRATGHPRWNELGAERITALAGLRPARIVGNDAEAVRLEVEGAGGGRRIIHNYGHGRTGVSLSWGCAAEVAHLAEGS
jgi:D-amino-acid oxidase